MSRSDVPQNLHRGCWQGMVYRPRTICETDTHSTDAQPPRRSCSVACPCSATVPPQSAPRVGLGRLRCRRCYFCGAYLSVECFRDHAAHARTAPSSSPARYSALLAWNKAGQGRSRLLTVFDIQRRVRWTRGGSQMSSSWVRERAAHEDAQQAYPSGQTVLWAVASLAR